MVILSSSNAPMSYRGPCGRGTPRWSVEGALFEPLNVTPSMAGLPVSRAKVWVGPPLSASAPSKGLVLLFEPDAEPQPHVTPSSMLLPPLMLIAPLQFPPDVLLARMVLRSVTVPPPVL